MTRPTAAQIADRALVLYALSRRAAIELALEGFGDDPHRIAQAERARTETDRWLARESLEGSLTGVERRLLEASSASWPREAVIDEMWRKEGLGVCLWALQHVAALPPVDDEFEVAVLNERIERYGSVDSFRANGALRSRDEIEAAWHEADAWLAATEGREGEDATIASITAERTRAFRWLLDGDAAPP